jgi:hypothetical protein
MPRLQRGRWHTQTVAAQAQKLQRMPSCGFCNLQPRPRFHFRR